MDTNTNQAGFASALAEGAKGLTHGLMTRDEAQLAKKQAQMKYKQLDYTDQTNAMQAEIDAAKATSLEASRKLQKEGTFRALKYFSTDGNPRHLNNLLLKDETMKKSGIVRFNKIDPSADAALMAQSREAYDFTDFSNDGSDRFVKATMQDGTEKIIDTFKVKQMTGYYDQVTDDELANELAKAKITKSTEGKQYSPGELEKSARFSASQGIAGGDLKETTRQLYNDKIQGNVAGKMDEYDTQVKELDKNFNGDFLANYDPAAPEEKNKAYQYIHRLEQYGGVELKATDRKDLKDIGMLVALGNPGKQITKEETGIMDSLITDLRKYVSDEGGSESVAAYATFRNSLRHALYGSALTDSEIAAFNEQFGTRRQQLAPLLRQMKIALTSVKGKLDTIANLNDPYVVKYRTGLNMDQLDSIISSLDQRVEYLNDLSSGKATSVMQPEDKAAQDKQKLRNAFGG